MKPKILDIIKGKVCPYCGKKPKLENSSVVYGREYGLIYLCSPCRAWVGVHKGSEKPLGRLANEELRYWKKEAHAAFDPIWQAKVNRGWGKFKARNSTYEWLAKEMNLPMEHTHIGMFDVNQCKKVVELCKNETMPRKKTAPVVKKEEPPVLLSRDEMFREEVLKTIKDHADKVRVILLDYLVTDGAELEIEQALSSLTITTKMLKFEEEEKKELSAKEIIEAAKDFYEIDKISCNQILDFLVEKEIAEYIKDRGYALIKVDTMDKQNKLRQFAETELWPAYNDQIQNILI